MKLDNKSIFTIEKDKGENDKCKKLLIREILG